MYDPEGVGEVPGRCTSPCPGDPMHMCGGRGYFSVWRTPTQGSHEVRLLEPTAVYDPILSAITLKESESNDAFVQAEQMLRS